MGKYNKITILVLLLLLIIGYLILHIYKTKRSVEYMLEHSGDNSTSLVVDNFTLNRNLNDGGYIKLSAIKGQVDRDKGRIILVKCQINYLKKKMNLYVQADDCSYENDNKIALKNGVQGSFNDISFYLGKNGDFEFMIDKGTGSISKGIMIIKGSSSLSADNVEFYKDTKEIHFYNNVRVIYEM
jgi:hypothetical protein